MSAAGRHAAGTARPSARAKLKYGRWPFIALSIFALLAALCGGLLRLGWSLPELQLGLYVAHGPLMVCSFIGTLISLERALDLGKIWSYGALMLSGAGAFA